jgi:hypothetical protein
MLAHESIDQPNQLTCGEYECAFVLGSISLVEFLLAILRILRRKAPGEVGGLNEIVTKIMVAGLGHFRVIGFEFPRLALAQVIPAYLASDSLGLVLSMSEKEAR